MLRFIAPDDPVGTPAIAPQSGERRPDDSAASRARRCRDGVFFGHELSGFGRAVKFTAAAVINLRRGVHPNLARGFGGGDLSRRRMRMPPRLPAVPNRVSRYSPLNRLRVGYRARGALARDALSPPLLSGFHICPHARTDQGAEKERSSYSSSSSSPARATLAAAMIFSACKPGTKS